jgi:hypothetical protein
MRKGLYLDLLIAATFATGLAFTFVLAAALAIRLAFALAVAYALMICVFHGFREITIINYFLSTFSYLIIAL